MDILALVDKYGVTLAMLLYFLWERKTQNDMYRKDSLDREKRIMAENKKREDRQLAIIEKLSDAFEELKSDGAGTKGAVIEIKNDLDTVRTMIYDLKKEGGAK